MTTHCKYCSTQLTNRLQNYCSSNCLIDHARSDRKSIEFRPNDLPVKCITSSGLLMECEDADHPTYMFPVRVLWDHEGPAEEMEQSIQLHALVYCDKQICVTVYEGSRMMWSNTNGRLIGGGSEWMKGFKICWEDLEKIRTKASELFSVGQEIHNSSYYNKKATVVGVKIMQHIEIRLPSGMHFHKCNAFACGWK